MSTATLTCTKYYRDDGVVLGLRRLGACWSDDTARRAVERAVGTEEGVLWLESRPGRT